MSITLIIAIAFLIVSAVFALVAYPGGVQSPLLWVAWAFAVFYIIGPVLVR